MYAAAREFVDQHPFAENEVPADELG
jgi:hypothetical protein